MKWFILVVTLLLMSASYGDSRSVTMPNEPVRKWLLTISYADGISAQGTLRLRDVIKERFVDIGGGLYRHFTDITFMPYSQYAPTIDGVKKAFLDLSKEIAKYKKESPKNQAHVAISWVGHGLTSKEGEYSLAVQDGEFSGDELVELFSVLGADEFLFFLNSCQSGSLVTTHLNADEKINKISRFQKELAIGIPDSFIAKITTQMKRNQTRMSVVVPVSKFINSRIFIWENILEQAFNLSDVDKNKDHIVTYEEWKNAVLLKSCSEETYRPQDIYLNVGKIKPPKVGVDPQFFDNSVPGKMPLYLTKTGSELYKQGKLELANYDLAPAILYSETKNICDTEAMFGKFLYNAELDQLLDAYEISNQFRKNKILDHFENIYYKFSDRFFNVLKAEYLTTKLDETKARAVFLIGLKSGKVDPGKDVDSFFKEVIKKFNKESYIVQTGIIQGLGKGKQKQGISLLVSILKGSDQELRVMSAESIMEIADKSSLSTLSEMLKIESNEEVKLYFLKTFTAVGDSKWAKFLMDNYSTFSALGKKEVLLYLAKTKIPESYNFLISILKNEYLLRVHALKALGVLGDKRLIPMLDELLNQDENAEVRMYSAYYLGRFFHTKSIPNLMTSAKNDISYLVRAECVSALGKLKAKNALELLKFLSQNDPSNIVRTRALQALKDINAI